MGWLAPKGAVVDVGPLGDGGDVPGGDDGVLALKVAELGYQTFKGEETALGVCGFGQQRFGGLAMVSRRLSERFMGTSWVGCGGRASVGRGS